MGAKNDGATCENRLDQELKGRLEDFFPDVSGWSLLKCARRLKEEGRALATSDVERAREEVLHVIRQRARDLGMRTLREDGIRKVLAGMTTPDEVITATMGDKE